MRLETDQIGAPVRLDEETFRALLDSARGEADPSPDVMAVLTRTDLAGPLRAALEPLVSVRLTVASAERRQVHRGWFTPDDGVLLLAVHDDVLQLQPLLPAFFAVTVARIVRLGPRRVSERGPRPVQLGLDSLTAADPGERAAALSHAEARYAWSLDAESGESRQNLTVVDGEQGAWLATGDTLVPTTATFLYRLLSTLLPAVSEASSAT